MEGDDQSTRDLLFAARNGDQEALSHLAERVRKALMLLGRGRVPKNLQGRFDTEDVVDSVIVCALREIGSFHYEGKGSLLRWLKTIFRNKLTSKIREHEALRRDVRREEPLATLEALASAFQGGGSRDDVARAEEYALLVVAFAELSDEHQRVIAHHFEGLGWEELGRLLGLSGRSARRRLTEALGELVKKVSRRPPDPR